MPNNPPSSSSSSSSSSDFLTSSMLYSSSFSSTMIGEYIGMESCLDLNINLEGEEDQQVIEDQHHEGYYNQRRKRDHDQRCMMKKKEFPPLITSLARTENQPSHMPWVLKRYYTNDGRLILREEKVRHHEYFKAHRSNGRLTLQLVPLDEDEDDVVDPAICSGSENGNENENEEQCMNSNEENKGHDDKNDDFATNQFDLVKLVSDNVNGNENVSEKELVKLASPSSLSASIGSGNGKCLIYSNVSKISPCLFEVPAIRPVH